MRKILVINGSASTNSSNQKLINFIEELSKDFFHISVYNELKTLPHFDPELSLENTPALIVSLKQKIQSADGIIICTPEYVFSIPSGLKNAIEWCVSSTVFFEKPLGIITASAQGEKGHEELQLIMKTLMTRFNIETTLLIPGIKGKINNQGNLMDPKTKDQLVKFLSAFKKLIS